MTVTITNDGKGKHQSWTAEAELSGNEGGNFTANLTAYGATEAEARANFDKVSQAAVMAICQAASEVHFKAPPVFGDTR